MSRPDHATLPTGLAGRLNPVCDRFEELLLAGQGPRVEDFLPSVEEQDRPALLRELLALELHYRGRQGTPVSAEDYRRRLPGYASVIDGVFGPPTVAETTASPC
jgi:serine/threonine-protein kinase